MGGERCRMNDSDLRIDARIRWTDGPVRAVALARVGEDARDRISMPAWWKVARVARVVAGRVHNGRAALIRPDHSYRTNVFYCPEA